MVEPQKTGQTMIGERKVLGLIPARGGSNGVQLLALGSCYPQHEPFHGDRWSAASFDSPLGSRRAATECRK